MSVVGVAHEPASAEGQPPHTCVSDDMMSEKGILILLIWETLSEVCLIKFFRALFPDFSASGSFSVWLFE